MLDLVGKPKCLFSHARAQIISTEHVNDNGLLGFHQENLSMQ